MQRFACFVDRNSAFSLAGTTNGDDVPSQLRQRCCQFPGGADKCAPPVFRCLLCTNLIHDVQRDGTEGPLLDNSVQPYQRTFAAGCSQVDGEYKSVVARCGHACSASSVKSSRLLTKGLSLKRMHLRFTRA